MKDKYDCYIASGWFNANQARDLENIKDICSELSIDYYSPKDEQIASSIMDNKERDNIFNNNINAIKRSNFVIVNTRDKDMGTIFESGLTYSEGKPIIYYCEGLKGDFNLMLSQSGIAVAINLEELKEKLKSIMLNIDYEEEYVGTIE